MVIVVKVVGSDMIRFLRLYFSKLTGLFTGCPPQFVGYFFSDFDIIKISNYRICLWVVMSVGGSYGKHSITGLRTSFVVQEVLGV